jgi:outer membrane protein TolC
MKHFIIKAGLTLAIATSSLSVFAETLNLDQIKQEVLSDNIEIKIQYEKYYQAQKNIGVALGNFLPRISFNLFVFNTTYGLLQGVVPTPSNWFLYKASKDLATAEKYNTVSVKLNILDGLTKNYIQVKKNQTALAILDSKLEIEKAYRDSLAELVVLGEGNEGEYQTAARRVARVQQDILLIESLNLKLKESIMIALDRDPREELTLANLPVVSENIPATVDEAQSIAINNASENMVNFYLYQAALDMTSSARWSFISFDGIGFGYPSTLAIEKSKARVIKLRMDQTDNQIRNQVTTAYMDLDILNQRIDNQNKICALMAEESFLNESLNNSGVLTDGDLVSNQVNLLSEEMKLENLYAEKRITIAGIQRLLSLETTLEPINGKAVEAGTFTTKVLQTRRRHTKKSISYQVPAELESQIYSIEYSVEGFGSYVVKDRDTNFAFAYSEKPGVEKTMNMKIKLINGEEINKSVVIGLK